VRVSRSASFTSVDLLNSAIEAHYEDIRAAVLRRGHSPGAASDIVHDLYVKLADNPGALAQSRSLKAFLTRAAVNLGIDRLRRSRLELRLFGASEDEAMNVVADCPAPDHAWALRLRLRVLRDAIIEMPERQRAVFIMHRLHQMTPDDIARRLRISRNMVDRHLRRALIHCLDRLAELN
jgi:RNA polymerase sigma-70 factor (ECF subfamily)